MVTRPQMGGAPDVDDLSCGCLLPSEPPFSPFLGESCRRASNSQRWLEGIGVDGDGPSATPDDVSPPGSSILDANSAVVKVWDIPNPTSHAVYEVRDPGYCPPFIEEALEEAFSYGGNR